jgi:hypothetical protein
MTAETKTIERHPYEGFKLPDHPTPDDWRRGWDSAALVWFDPHFVCAAPIEEHDPNAAQRWETYRKNYIKELKRKQAELEANWIEHCLTQIRHEEFASSVQIVLENSELVECIKGHFVKWAHN